MKLCGLVFLAFGVAATPPATAADVDFFGIIKSQEFVQTNVSTPFAQTTNGFAFDAFVVASADQVVTQATVKLSNSSPLQHSGPVALRGAI